MGYGSRLWQLQYNYLNKERKEKNKEEKCRRHKTILNSRQL